MKTNKINQNVILETIDKEAAILLRKMVIYEQIKALNSELKILAESVPPMVSSFGFKHDGDALSKTKTGFETSPNISFIAQLEKEMSENSDSTLNEVEILKQENEMLKKEIEDWKSKLPTIKLDTESIKVIERKDL